MGLAGPKKKVKYSIDPNALNWANDESKFGKKLLKSMGWQEGKGLGARENGITEHIRVQTKNDTKGVGFNNNDYDDVWLEHQSDFDSILSNLKQATAKTDTQVQLKPLEESSKASRARVHYRKFTRSKDLTNASEKDLDCILGFSKRSQQQHQQSYQSESQDEETKQIKEEKILDAEEPQSSLITVTNELSINDYFKNKMEQLKRKRETELVENVIKQEPNDEIQDHKKSKKKKKNKSNDNDSKPLEEENIKIKVEIEDGVENMSHKIKKKKKKSKETEESLSQSIDVSIKQENFDYVDASTVKIETTETTAHMDETDTNEKQVKEEDLSHIYDTFKGSNLFEINGYSPYMVTRDIKALLDDKYRKANKKRNYVLTHTKSVDYVNAKRPQINFNKV